MKKITCFDLDGVTIYEHEPFSVRIVDEQGSHIAPAVEEFFKTIFSKVMIGEVSLEAALTPYVGRFGWQGNTSSLIDFWFEGEREFNTRVLEVIDETAHRGVPTILVTDNPKEKIQYLWKLGLNQCFDNRYVSGETGLKKNDPRLWVQICKELGVQPKDIYFTDDDSENIEVAESAGITAKLYTTPEDLRSSLQRFLETPSS